MARITVEDCLEKLPNRFELTLLAAKRARQLIRSGEDPLVPWENDKSTVVALREIADGLVTYESMRTKELVREADLFANATDMLAQAAAEASETTETTETTEAVATEAANTAEVVVETKVDIEIVKTNDDAPEQDSDEKE